MKCYAGCDDTFVAWKLTERIPNLRGFALFRLREGHAEEVVKTWVGFECQPHEDGERRDSTKWPIQKFQWTDYMVRAGDKVRYRVVPMVGDKDHLTPDDANASPWTEPAQTVGPAASPHIEASFNRGIVAAQWLARRLDPEHAGLTAMRRELDKVVKTVGDPIRDYLGGPLKARLSELLDAAITEGRHVYAVLYELDDPELLDRLKRLGKKAHLVLANGSVKKKGLDQNKEARKALRGVVDLNNRMVSPSALGHNKFLVVCNKANKPLWVWTGSTNWTKTGLCTQANNAILVGNPKLAREFKNQYDLLKKAKDGFPTTLIEANSKSRGLTFDGSKTTVWFTRTSDQQDLEQARGLINGAEHAILFLMFNPGPSGTLLNTIIERGSKASPYFNDKLYIHGVCNQDPATKGKPVLEPVEFFHRGMREGAPFDVVLPAAVNEQLGYWRQELLKKNGARAMVHSKVIVLDPFSAHPVVMTGSHNLGPKASATNDENLLIIENHSQLAAAYAVQIMAIYNQYRWRFRMGQRGGEARWKGLEDNDTWQDDYLKGAKLLEMKFWMGV